MATRLQRGPRLPLHKGTERARLGTRWVPDYDATVQVVRIPRMKRIAEAAAAQLATRPGSDKPITSEEMVRVLARIARMGPPAARLRAIELLSTRMALFPEATGASPLAALSDEERAERISAILERARHRRAPPAEGQ